jgi:hypothetical protein
MTNGVKTEIALWTFAVTGTVGLLAAAIVPLDSGSPAPRVAPVAERVARHSYPDSSEYTVVRRDVFRLDRRPPAVAYDPQRGSRIEGGGYVVRPTLVLRGVVWGDSARAVVGGLPGLDGDRVVRAGEVVSGLRVVAIGRRSVRIAAPDTTWQLQLERRTP